MLKQFKCIILIICIFTLNSANALSPKPGIFNINKAYQCYPKNCEHLPKPVIQPNGPFAVFAFCEDAAGTHIAVSCFSPGVCEKSVYPNNVIRFGGWQLYDRFWQEKNWASDVTSFVWSPDGKNLYVATSGIYGTASLYKLDLEARKSVKLFENNNLDNVFIIGISPKGEHLYYQLGENKEILTFTLKGSK